MLDIKALTQQQVNTNSTLPAGHIFPKLVLQCDLTNHAMLIVNKYIFDF